MDKVRIHYCLKLFDYKKELTPVSGQKVAGRHRYLKLLGPFTATILPTGVPPMLKTDVYGSLLLLLTAAGATWSFSQNWIATGLALAILAVVSGFRLGNKQRHR